MRPRQLSPTCNAGGGSAPGPSSVVESRKPNLRIRSGQDDVRERSRLGCRGRADGGWTQRTRRPRPRAARRSRPPTTRSQRRPPSSVAEAVIAIGSVWVPARSSSAESSVFDPRPRWAWSCSSSPPGPRRSPAACSRSRRSSARGLPARSGTRPAARSVAPPGPAGPAGGGAAPPTNEIGTKRSLVTLDLPCAPIVNTPHCSLPAVHRLRLAGRRVLERVRRASDGQRRRPVAVVVHVERAWRRPDSPPAVNDTSRVVPAAVVAGRRVAAVAAGTST